MTKIIVLLLIITMNAYSKEIKIIDWNTYLLPKIAKRTSQTARVKLIAQYLKNSPEDFDIITLQEVFTKDGYHILTQELADKYPYHTGSPIRKWYKPVNSGLLILSKFPIKETSFYVYSGMAHADRFSSKGVLATTIEIEEGMYVQVANTHLQAQDGKKYEKLRLSEYKYIKEAVIDNFKIDELPLILTGDYNINTFSSKEFDPFLEYMQFEAPKISGDLRYTINSDTNNLVETSPKEPVIHQILDYIFLVPGAYSEQIQKSYILHPKGDYSYHGSFLKDASLSDHLPMISIINI